ncbi:DUF72 domain-containing protein [Deinococcus sp. QL22]|uniref:DUF72 domain-containing protein n=1 Tax=Deinococcus sp. QL22 TaxID=2939437 RepID=UPI002017F4EF|nr:DUF72 domain-containing protein [Deinococcus sp. QL22]UQN09826.1 DUF72 domain-containing protein [Deinococcus sp. QL22]
MPDSSLYLGCAGWNIASGQRSLFGPGESVLQRYATRLNAVEINSSFYRPHRQSTYQRWADTVPDAFRFSVKLPRTITHDARLHGCEPLLSVFLSEAGGLGHKLGCLLVQLPPSLVFASELARTFFQALRRITPVPVVCEPRHPSWFTPEADELLATFSIGRVAADPLVTPGAAVPGGFGETTYYRWHGSPRIYASSYAEETLLGLTRTLHGHAADRVWVVFDNTASGAAVDNALTLQRLVAARPE